MIHEKNIRDGMARCIWHHAWETAKMKPATPPAVPQAAKDAAHDLELAYLKVNCAKSLAELPEPQDEADRPLGARDYGWRLAANALGIEYTGHWITSITPRLKVTLTKSAGDLELSWDAKADLGWDGESPIGAVQGSMWDNPRARRNPLSKDRYAVVRDGIVLGHVEATWLGDASDLAEAKFGNGVVAFVETPGKPTQVGEKHWIAKRRNPGSRHEWPASKVQSLLFSKKVFTADQAKHWAKEHGYLYGSVDTTGSYHRLRQEAPTGGPCRTISFGDGISAIVCSSGSGRPPGVP